MQRCNDPRPELVPAHSREPRQPALAPGNWYDGMLLKLCLLVALACAPSPSGFAAPVTFWFGGIIERTNNPAGNMPSELKPGSPFWGKVTYDGDFIAYQTTSAGGAVGNYYFRKLEGFRAHVQIGAHTLTNALLSSSGWSGNISVYDNFDGADQMFIDIGQAGLMIDGQPHTNSVIELYLSDRTLSAHSSPALPSSPPVAASFPSRRELSWLERDPNGQTSFYVSGTITEVTTQPLVALNIRRTSPSEIQVGWPKAISGAQLQWSAEPAPNVWQNAAGPVVDVGEEHTITFPSATTAKYFRLVLP